MDTHFGNMLREAVFSTIERINLSGSHLVAFGWDNSSARVLKTFLEEKIVAENELLADIHLRLRTLGRRSFEQHKQGEHPDHTYSPHALAYAIENGEFTKEERSSIKYDHGDTEATFIKAYNSGDLRKKVLDQMLTEKENILYSTESICCCSH